MLVQHAYNGGRYCIDTLLHIAILVVTWVTMVLNIFLGLLILFEEILVGLLILPFIPLNRLGDLICSLRSWGLPLRLPLSLYIFFIALVVSLNVIGLELHYLDLNDQLLSSFDEFKSNTFSAIKLFVVLHRFLYLLSNESNLRSRLRKCQQDDDLQDETAEDPRVEKLRRELEETRTELEKLKVSYEELATAVIRHP